MEIKIKTELNIGLMESIIAEKNKVLLITSIIVSAIIILPAVFFLILFYRIPSVRILTLGIILLGILFVPFIYYFGPAIQMTLRNALIPKKSEAVIEYVLTENEIVQQTTRKNGMIEIKKFEYSMLKEAEERKNEFVIYVSKMQVFVLPKKDINQGSVEDLRNLLRQKFGNQFK